MQLVDHVDAAARHVEVDDAQVRRGPDSLANGVGSVCHLGDDVEVGVLERTPDPGAHDRVVVGDQDPAAEAHSNVTFTVVPPPSTSEATSSSPPSARARSAMLTSPKPPSRRRVGSAAVSKPRPSSRTATENPAPVDSSSIETVVASECLAAFVTASETIRNTACSTSGVACTSPPSIAKSSSSP